METLELLFTWPKNSRFEDELIWWSLPLPYYPGLSEFTVPILGQTAEVGFRSRVGKNDNKFGYGYVKK